MKVFSKHIPESGKSPIKPFQETYKKEAEGLGARVLPITVDRNGRERIGFVKKATFSPYVLFHRDPKFILTLPDFHLPMLGAGSFRAFEVADDAMSPLEPGSIVVGEYVQDWEKLSSGKTFIVVHEQLGILYRRLYKNKYISDLKLVAEKKDYPNSYVNLDKVLEIWEARMFMSI